MKRAAAVFVAFLVGCEDGPMDRPESRHRVYNPADDGIPNEAPSEIYDLPADNLPSEIRLSLTPWVAGFVGRPLEARKQRWNARWAMRPDSPIRGLADHYRGYEPTSLVTRGSRAWLLCVRPETASTEADCCLVPEPPDPAAVRDRLRRRGFDDPLLAEFVTCFAGWREDFEPNNGRFIDVEELDGRGVIEIDDWLRGYDGIDRYEGSLKLYSARDGNELLVHPSGRVGWLIGQEKTVREFAADFRQFCANYEAYRTAFVRSSVADKLVSWPFDAYGPPPR